MSKHLLDRERITTSAPNSFSPWAIARPRPTGLPTPVTNAFLPVRSNIFMGRLLLPKGLGLNLPVDQRCARQAGNQPGASGTTPPESGGKLLTAPFLK